MTQYLMQKSKDFEHLQYALDNYKALLLVIRPFSLDDSKFRLAENLENKTLRFTLDNGIRLFTDRELVHFPLQKHHTEGFKLEYRDNKDLRLYPYYTDPNDPRMPSPTKSVFRVIFDKSLVEIDFEGKILLELAKLVNNKLDNSYWKLAKIK